MLRALFRTGNDWTLTVARLALGTMMFAHGAQKLLGWFGGYGVEGTLGFFSSLGLPVTVGLVVIVGESLAGLGLIVGFFSRVSAAGTVAIMLGAVAIVHIQFGYFMNWGGQQGGEGFELHVLALALALLVLVKGAGAVSLDRWIAGRLTEPTVQPAGMRRAA